MNDSIAAAYPATIWVCPGQYPEQVQMRNTPNYAPIITLKGSNLTAGAAVITPPATWAPYFSQVYGWVAAQILVTDTTGVAINNIEVNGGDACPVLPGMGAPALIAGVMFVDNGDPLTSSTEAGTIRYVTAHDQVPTYDGTCGQSAGIVAENAYIQINDNIIHDVNYAGILEYGGNAQMLRNNITNSGYTAIRSTAAHPVDVSLNVINNTYYGIVLESGTNTVQVDKNSFSPTVSTAIYLHGAFGNYIRYNTINGPWIGIALEGDPNYPNSGNLVESNNVSNCGYACLTDSNSSGQNRLDSNTLTNSASYGIWLFNVADFLSNGTAPNPPPPPYIDWDSIYSNKYTTIPIKICHAVYNGSWGCTPGDQ